MQFSLIYQVWLHTEVVYNMGPLEYIINTPRQHRVHHGKNTYCIDKNYGALIMIFDRLFGTYQAEEEKIVFGTTTKPMETFDTSILHFSYYNNVWQKFKQQVGLKNKLYALFAGPGWEPGKPRLGLLSGLWSRYLVFMGISLVVKIEFPKQIFQKWTLMLPLSATTHRFRGGKVSTLWRTACWFHSVSTSSQIIRSSSFHLSIA